MVSQNGAPDNLSPGFFPILNALVDSGWLSKLSKVELALLICHLKFMNTEGIAWPAAATIAKLIGYSSDRHVSTARQKLVRRGLLVDVGDWQNGSKTRRYKLVIPPPTDSVTPDGNSHPRPIQSSTPDRFGRGPLTDSGQNPRRKRSPNPLNELTNEQTNEPHTGCVGLLVGEFGLGKAEAKKLASGKSPGDINAIIGHVRAKHAAGKVDSVQGYIRHCLKNGGDVSETFEEADAFDSMPRAPITEEIERIALGGKTTNEITAGELLRIGVNRGKIFDEIINNKHVGALAIWITVAMAETNSVKKGIGWIIEQLRGLDAFYSGIPPQVAAWLVNNEKLTHVGRFPAIRAKWNKDGLYLHDIDGNLLGTIAEPTIDLKEFRWAEIPEVPDKRTVAIHAEAERLRESRERQSYTIGRVNVCNDAELLQASLIEGVNRDDPKTDLRNSFAGITRTPERPATSLGARVEVPAEDVWTEVPRPS